MDDEMDLKIDTSQWENLLKALPIKVAKSYARKALQAGGDILRDAMEAEAPERTDEATPGSNALPPGVLKADLTTQIIIGSTSAPRVKIGPGSLTGYVAWWIENGFDHYEAGTATGRKRKWYGGIL